jgi:hypothetical protein
MPAMVRGPVIFAAVLAAAVGAVAGAAAGQTLIVPVAPPTEAPPEPFPRAEGAALPPLPPAAAGRHFASDIQLQGPIKPLVDALHSTQFSKREEATRSLLRLGTERLDEVSAALEKETDAEAAGRLTQAAMHLFLKRFTSLEGPSSLLGIRFTPELVRLDPKKEEDLRMTVAVAELKPGYPAAQELRVGDRVLGIDGKLFAVDMGTDDFRENIVRRRPGSIVRLTVVREGRQVDVDVQLAALPGVGVSAIDTAIAQREAALVRFVANLRTAAATEPLTMSGAKEPEGVEVETIDGVRRVRIIVP